MGRTTTTRVKSEDELNCVSLGRKQAQTGRLGSPISPDQRHDPCLNHLVTDTPPPSIASLLADNDVDGDAVIIDGICDIDNRHHSPRLPLTLS